MKTVMDKGLFACVCGPMVAETCTLLEEMLAQKHEILKGGKVLCVLPNRQLREE